MSLYTEDGARTKVARSGLCAAGYALANKGHNTRGRSKAGSAIRSITRRVMLTC